MHDDEREFIEETQIVAEVRRCQVIIGRIGRLPINRPVVLDKRRQFEGVVDFLRTRRSLLTAVVSGAVIIRDMQIGTVQHRRPVQMIQMRHISSVLGNFLSAQPIPMMTLI